MDTEEYNHHCSASGFKQGAVKQKTLLVITSGRF